MSKRKIIIILVILILAELLIYLGYFLGSRDRVCQPESEEPGVLTPQKLGAGDIGEIGETPLVTAILPPAIFSTAGIIIEIKSDRIILRGDGSNFADGLPRTLTATITDLTLIFSKNQFINYSGKEGLRHLKTGMEILIDSQENIRGKVEFKIKTINIL